jgi:hypothetical protein
MPLIAQTAMLLHSILVSKLKFECQTLGSIRHKRSGVDSIAML